MASQKIVSMLVNLTPHDIVVCGQAVPKSGLVARVEEENEGIGHLEDTQFAPNVRVTNIPVVSVEYGEVFCETISKERRDFPTPRYWAQYDGHIGGGRTVAEAVEDLVTAYGEHNPHGFVECYSLERNIYIVSGMVRSALGQTRPDVMSPDTGETALRNEKGHVTGVTRLKGVKE